MYNPRLAIHKLYETLLREQYGPSVFETRVPYAADFKEAIAQRKPIAQYKPKGASAKAIKALADELLARLADARCIDHDPGGRVMSKLDELMKASRADRLGVDGTPPGRDRDAPCIGPGRGPHARPAPGHRQVQERRGDPPRQDRPGPRPAPRGIRARGARPARRIDPGAGPAPADPGALG